ncbi:MAG TPA: NBR1-Ig-like domain-containing protein, partial [Nannocystaceae bacterium]|nr:NBR1-Ig-like domain-containing protein [Nannocystaceae bacterium]
MLSACGGDGTAADADGSGSGDELGPDSGAGDDGGADTTDGGMVDGDGAAIESASLPTALACGEAFTAEIMVRNVGTTTWTRADGYALGAVDDSDPLSASGRIELPDGVEVAPGDAHGFAFELVAPADPVSITTDWRMVHEQVQWFGETAAADVDVTCTPAGRSGPVRLEGRSFVDDGGPFVALGATMMWGAWGYRNDRARLEENLAFLADNGFHYVRALGVVGDPNGEDFWDGREIDFHWPDYADVIRGFTELAWDEYGLRVEWTLIGDGQVAVPTPEERDALADVFVDLAATRPDAIIHFELANEAWQNGFPGDEGIAELRARTSDLRARTDVLVAASAAYTDSCENL